MEVSFDIKLTPKDLFCFNMFQTYTTTQGPTSIILAIIVIVMSVISFRDGQIGYGLLYVAAAVLFVVYIPGSLWGRAKAALKKNEVLAGTLHYQISQKGIEVFQGEDSGLLPWDAIYKMVSNKKQVLIYSNRVNAYIIPREQLGDKYDALKEIARKQLPNYRFRMK